jgi:psiF repeat
MNMSKILGGAFAALILSAGVSLADPAATATTATAKPAATATATVKPAKHVKMAKMHDGKGKFAAKSEKGKECSAQADTQGLHGKARRHFRKGCMKAASLSAPSPAKVKQATAATTTAH